MELSIMTDSATIATAQQGLGFAKFVLKCHEFNSNNICLSENSPDQPSFGIPQISALLFTIDSIAPPVKRNSKKTFSRTLIRKKRRTRRKSFSGDSDDVDGGGIFGNGDGPFGGGSGGGWGGSGWNFDGFGGQNWDESSSRSDLAMDFIYEVICWIALSSCVHFAFKKVVMIVADGGRQKAHMSFTSVC